MYYCWHCYGEVETAAGSCSRCGGVIAAPAGADYVDKLVWALHHPLPERRVVAADTLGHLRDPRATLTLSALLDEDPDPYLQAAAISALLAIEGAPRVRPLLERLVTDGSAPARHVAVQALQTLEDAS